MRKDIQYPFKLFLMIVIFLFLMPSLHAAQDTKPILSATDQQKIIKSYSEGTERQKAIVQITAVANDAKNLKDKETQLDSLPSIIPYTVTDVEQDISITKMIFTDSLKKITLFKKQLQDPLWRKKMIAQGIKSFLETVFITTFFFILHRFCRKIIRKLLRPGHELTLIRRLIDSFLLVIYLIFTCRAWGADSIAWAMSLIGQRLGWIAIVAILSLITWEWLNFLIERYLDRTDHQGLVVRHSARVLTLLPFLRNAVMILLVMFFIFVVLSAIGINIAPFLAGAGVIGVAIGFGAQKLVQDLITGAFILFEDSIAVGDEIKLGDLVGHVESLTIRTVRLRDATGQLHTIPFSGITLISNLSRGHGFHVFKLTLALDSDIEQVQCLITSITEKIYLRHDLIEKNPKPLEWFGIDKITSSGIMISGRFKTRPGKQVEAGRLFNKYLLESFKQSGLSLAIPTRRILMRDDSSSVTGE